MTRQYFATMHVLPMIVMLALGLIACIGWGVERRRRILAERGIEHLSACIHELQRVIAWLGGQR